MKKMAILMLMIGLRLFGQDNWFLAQSDVAVVDSIQSTSELVEGQYGGAFLYPPINLLDGDFDTTWCEADEGGSGIGETISLSLSEPLSFDEIQVVNGFSSGNDYYNKNNRVAKITLTQTAGEHFQQKQYTLRDGVEDWQSITFEYTQTAQTISFRIDQVYRGFKYDDTCLSDIRFLMKGRVIPFENVEEIRVVQEEHSRAMLNAQKGAFMEQIKKMAAQNGNDDHIYLKEPGADRGVKLNFSRGIDTSSISISFNFSDLSIYVSDDFCRFFDRFIDGGGVTFNGWDYSPEPEWAQSAEGLKELLGSREYLSFDGTDFFSNRWTSYYLQEHKILIKENVDYIEPERIMFLKLDGSEGLYINGVYYELIDEDQILEFYYDGP